MDLHHHRLHLPQSNKGKCSIGIDSVAQRLPIDRIARHRWHKILAPQSAGGANHTQIFVKVEVEMPVDGERSDHPRALETDRDSSHLAIRAAVCGPSPLAYRAMTSASLGLIFLSVLIRQKGP